MLVGGIGIQQFGHCGLFGYEFEVHRFQDFSHNVHLKAKEAIKMGFQKPIDVPTTAWRVLRIFISWLKEAFERVLHMLRSKRDES